MQRGAICPLFSYMGVWLPDKGENLVGYLLTEQALL